MADLTTTEYWETAILRAAGRLFMLAALAEEPRHGYGIARKIAEYCDGCCDPSDAMIYPGLRDLEKEGLVTCTPEEVDGRTRNVCALTEKGREALRVGAAVWAPHLPAISRVVAAARENTSVERVQLTAACCPACGPSGEC